VEPFADSFLPCGRAGTMVPALELVGGAFVVLGLGLILLGSVLVMVSFGHLVAERLYALNAHVIPRLILVVFLFMVPPAWDRFSFYEWATGRSSND
jgi:cytochrome c oxidase subunit IV